MSIVSIRFQRIHLTREQRGISNSAFYREMDEGLFTKPVKIGVRSAAHPVHEVDAILGARLNGATDDQLRKLVVDLHERRKQYLPEAMRSAAVTVDDES